MQLISETQWIEVEAPRDLDEMIREFMKPTNKELEFRKFLKEKTDE